MRNTEWDRGRKGEEDIDEEKVINGRMEVKRKKKILMESEREINKDREGEKRKRERRIQRQRKIYEG